MDRILVFREGKIIEEGTHAELIKQEGHYSQLWRCSGRLLARHIVKLKSGGFYSLIFHFDNHLLIELIEGNIVYLLIKIF